MSDAVSPIGPRSDYWDSDAQLFPTVGPDVDPADVEAADEQTVRRVLEAINAPARMPDPEPDNPSAVAIRPDGSTGDLPTMAIPGFGDAYSDCGDDMPMCCAGCGATTTVGRTCRRSTCPRCGAAWVRDRAANICSRLGTVRAVRDSNRDEHQRYHHLSMIAPEDWRLQDPDVLERTLHMIRDVLDAIDMEAYVFYHPWSGSGFDDDEEGDDRGKWKDRLFNGRDWTGDVRDELKFRPHFHIVGIANHVPGQDFTKMLYEQTGWILTRITGSESSVSIYDDDDLAKVVTYCLSHSAIDETAASDGSAQKTYRRYGSLINSSDVTVTDDTQKRHDRLVRRAATTTLGIPMADQFCLSETVGDTRDLSTIAIRSKVIAAAAADDDVGDRDPDLEHVDDDAAGSLPDAPAPADCSTPLETPDRRGDEDLSLVVETSECEGRLIHLADARKLMDDPEWVEQAQHADQLQTTLDEWSDRMHELIRAGPFNSG